MEVNGDIVTFSTGTKVYANLGLIGIGSDLYVSEGYDGWVPAWPTRPGDKSLTKEERQELADYMIALWTKFREADGPLEGAE
jgi:hypothetical protein